ncbi:hypothetical protein Ahy_B10g105269 isoform B [Arachis hypogaea]|uniref:Peptidase A2 domain-containing protein n=1 Tax=Arachis hypogaea TaxID=3818 RepID=A0A444X7L2_ARAHY|nr:hypothetical protein Ahy_B10g105269 isoform B [Arachis hypogaea]
MGDVLEETPSSQDDSQPINPTPEHREVTNQARIASTIQNANDHDITDRRHPEKASDKAAQIIQDLCLRVQELEGRITDKGKHNNEHGSHATSRSRSRRGRSPTRRHDRRDGRSSTRDHRHEKSPERRYNKKHNRSASQDLSYQHYSDEDRRNRNTKRTRNDHIIMGATPFTERILRAKLPKGFDKPTDMKYDGTKDPQEHLTAFEAIRDGKLPEFAKIIRELRRAERDRSSEREGRNPRTQKQPPRENPEEDPTIIVNVITGKDVSSKSKLTMKKDLKIMAVRNQVPISAADNTITFLPEDCQHGTSAEDAPFVISARIGTGLVRRILVDTGADSNILFRGAFDKLGLRNDNLQTHRHGVTGLGDNFLKPDGSITLPITIGTSSQKKTILSEFVVLKDSTAYNVILGRKTINDFSAVIFTKYLLMKFRTDDGSVGTIHGDREVAAECDNTSLALRKKSRDAAGVFLADLDARQDGQPRPEPEGDMEKLQIGPTKDEYTFINRNLPYDLKEELSQLLKQNRDLFAFTPADMPGISPDLMSHRLAVDPKAKPIAQRRRKMSPDRATEVKNKLKPYSRPTLSENSPTRLG